MTIRSRNELWGRTLMDELARSGVRHVIVSPGSRSTPLVLAAAADQRLRVVPRVDERSAGFIALGAGKATGAPAAVITTSGTAVANLLPAVVEASVSETPLLVLTADRPPWLRGADANQTIEQRAIFGQYVHLFEDLPPGDATERALCHLRSVACRAVSVAKGDPAGPVHLNLPFPKPLEPTPDGSLPQEHSEARTPGSLGRDAGLPWTVVGPGRAGPLPAEVREVAQELRQARLPLLVAGVTARPWDSGPVIRRVAELLGIPLLADPLSGARYPEGNADSNMGLVVGGYDVALSSPALRKNLIPDLIFRIGSAPVSAALGSWLESLPATPHFLVDGGGGWKDHAAVVTRLIRSDPTRFLEALEEELASEVGATPPASSWFSQWQEVEAQVRSRLGEPGRTGGFEGAVVGSLVPRLDADDLLFVSNSMPVRDLDTFVPTLDKPLAVLGNRGASGIDGVVSTAAGVSLALGRRVVVVVGDLALLHDSGALSFLREPGVRVLVVVLNNDGGGIFHFLPVREFEPAFTRLFATPHGRDLSVLAQFHGLPHLRLEEPTETDEEQAAGGGGSALGEAWAAAAAWEGSGVLEIMSDRDRNREKRLEVVREVSSALGTVVSAERL